MKGLKIIEKDSSYIAYELSDSATLFKYTNGKCAKIILKNQKQADCNLEEYILNYNVKIITINGVFNDDILNQLNSIEVIKFMYTNIFDINKFYVLKNIRQITLEDTYNMGIDFSNFKKLAHLNIYWNPNIKINLCSKLKWLRVYSFNNENCISFFSNSIEYLEIIQSKLKSLEGIGNLKNLKSLVLYKLKSVENFHYIGELKNLEYLMIDSCLKLTNIDWISGLKKLKYICLIGSNEIESLKPLNEINSLEGIILSMKIKDGDKSILKIKNDYKILNYKSPYDNLLYDFEKNGNIRRIPY